MFIRSLAATLLVALGLAGCGLKGPLYLPDKATNVEVHPAPPSPPAEPAPERDREKSRSGTTPPAPGE